MSDSSNRSRYERSLRIANIDSALATGFGTLLGGVFIVGFIQYLARVYGLPKGRTDSWIGLFSAIPSLCGILLVPGSIIGRRFKSYKKYIFRWSLVWRIMHMPWMLMPLLPLAAEARFAIMLCCGTIGNLCQNMVGATYSDWLSQMVEPKSRGFYFTWRTAILVMSGSLVGLAGGLVLDLFKRNGLDVAGYTTVFVIALCLAWCSQYFFNQMQDIEQVNVVRTDLRETLAQMARPLRNRSFRPVLIFAFVSIVGQTFAGNFFNAYALDTLQIPTTILVLLGLMQATGQFVASRPWGALMDSYGTRPVVALAGIGIVLAPVMWLFTIPGHFYFNVGLLMVFHFIGGTFWAGALPGNFNILLANSPNEERAPYLATGATVQAIAGFCSPLLGAVMLSSLRPYVQDAVAYKCVFAGSMAFRFLAVAFLIPIHEANAKSLRATVSGIWSRLVGGFQN